MGVLRTLKKWRSGYWKPIGAEQNSAGIAQRLDAVEYELNCLNRDLARIGVERSKTQRSSRATAG